MGNPGFAQNTACASRTRRYAHRSICTQRHSLIFSINSENQLFSVSEILHVELDISSVLSIQNCTDQNHAQPGSYKNEEHPFDVPRVVFVWVLSYNPIFAFIFYNVKTILLPQHPRKHFVKFFPETFLISELLNGLRVRITLNHHPSGSCQCKIKTNEKNSWQYMCKFCCKPYKLVPFGNL